MNTIAAYFPQMDLRLRGIEAAGTPAGARLGWDKRGRGRNKKLSPLHSAFENEFQQHGHLLKKETIHKMFDLMANDRGAADAMPLAEKAKHIGWWGKTLGALGDGWQKYDGLRHIGEFVTSVAITLAAYVAHPERFHEALTWAMQALHPAMQHLMTMLN